MFPKALPDDALNSLAILGESKILDNCYLAGGTGLALQLGHRRSIDFDFFSQSLFEPLEIADKLKNAGDFQIEQQTPKTLIGTFNQVRFSLFHYPYPLVAPTLKYLGVDLAGINDISAMKLVAITGRGTKKDFVDLYALTKHGLSLEQMFGIYQQKYQLLEQNRMLLLKSLQYFVDADASEMPIMLMDVEWKSLKQFFQKETLLLWKQVGTNLSK